MIYYNLKLNFRLVKRHYGDKLKFRSSDLELIYDFAQLHTKSNIFLSFKLSDLVFFICDIITEYCNNLRWYECISWNTGLLIGIIKFSVSLLSHLSNSLLISLFSCWRKVSKLDVTSDLTWRNASSTTSLNGTTVLLLVLITLRSDSHVLEKFYQIKFFPSLVRKNTIICLFGV